MNDETEKLDQGRMGLRSTIMAKLASGMTQEELNLVKDVKVSLIPNRTVNDLVSINQKTNNLRLIDGKYTTTNFRSEVKLSTDQYRKLVNSALLNDTTVVALLNGIVDKALSE